MAANDPNSPQTEAPLLYHYTSAAGLMGIVQKREIWATESNYLNDPSEVSYASKVLVGLLRRAADGADGHNRDRVNQAVDLLERAYADPHSPHQYIEDRSFITSFSRSDHSLTLWRLYSGRTGYCVGFDKDKLLSWLGHGYPAGDRADLSSLEDQERYDAQVTNFDLIPRVHDVRYGEEPVRAVLEEVLAASADDGKPFEPRLRELFRQLSGIKHKAFEDEREVRLVVNDAYHLPYSETRISAAGELVAYRRVAFPFEAVRSITMAPGANYPRTRRALRSLLNTGGRGAWEHVGIRECDLPFVW